jgi:non-canonical purine NTP pyrophosphatase (RdgB/HAM1 family)
MKTWVFATNNGHKLAEVRSMAPEGVEIASLKDTGCTEELPETADTLEGNALQKARYVRGRYGCDCFADDTGLEVEALGNAPGVHSARYAGPDHDSAANVRKLLAALEGEANRRARFRTVIALVREGKEYVFEGIVEGTITEEERGGGGFGYDPVFVPDGYGRTFAELGNEIKNRISHRAMAVRKLMEFLGVLLVLLSGYMPQRAAAQVTGAWKSYMAYYTTTAVEEAEHQVFALANGSLYSYGKEDRSIRLYSKENGLSDTQISRIGYNADVKALLICYSNGNIDLLDEKGVYNIPHLMKNTMVQDKTVNSLFFRGEYAYLAAEFGIMLVNMERREITDTYRLNHSVYGVCIRNDSLFAATSGGVTAGSLNSNLLDVNNWNVYPPVAGHPGDVSRICLFRDALCFFQKGAGVYYLQGDGTVRTLLQDNAVRDMGLQNGELILYRPDNAVVFSSLTERRTLNTGELYGISSLKEGVYWVACGAEGLKGLQRNGSGGEYEWFVSGIRIDSPKRDLAAYMKFHGQKLLVAGGGRWSDRFNNPGTLMVYGEGKWYNFDEADIARKSGIRFSDATCVAVDPADENHYFVSTWGEGVYEFKDNEFVKLYNIDNSPLETSWTGAKYNYIRVDGLCFDRENNLWMTNSSVPSAIKVLKADGTWVSIGYSEVDDRSVVDKILITSRGHKWVNVLRSDHVGILVFDDRGTIGDTSDDIVRFFSSFSSPGSAEGQVSASFYYCMAEDREGRIWLGTNLGPVICPAPANAIEYPDRLTANRIVRTADDGSLSYFLDGENVRCITVDGGNRKWLGTQNSGLFIVSADGLETIAHFTTDNSPLPSDYVQSIAIDALTGEAFIGTDKGIVSYAGGATEGLADYSQVYAFPNPVRPGYQDQVTVTGLMPDSNVKITDINGNLIFQGKSLGGQLTWNCCKRNGQRVATGVYLVLSATEGAGESVVTKIMVIK